MMEWRNGQLMDDNQIEEYWQFCERKQKKLPSGMVTQYDILMGWALAGLGIGAFSALLWMFIR